MSNFIINNFYIFLSIILGVISQLIVKWKMGAVDFEEGASFIDKSIVVLYMLLNPYIILSIMLTFLAGLAWMMAMTKFEISYAYPFTSLGFVLILFLSALLLGEAMTWPKVVGSIFITVGIIISSKSL